MQIKGNIKYVIIAIIIIVFVFLVGAFVITSLDNIVADSQVEDVKVIVAKKYISNDTQHHFVIVSDEGVMYDIMNLR